MAKKVQATSGCRCRQERRIRVRRSVPRSGQHGVNIMEFCKAFNADTQGMEWECRFPW